MNSVNSLYLIIGKADGYIEENYRNKYLVFTSTDGNRKVVAKSAKLWDEIKHLMGHSMHSAKKNKKKNEKIKNDDLDLFYEYFSSIMSCEYPFIEKKNWPKLTKKNLFRHFYQES